MPPIHESFRASLRSTLACIALWTLSVSPTTYGQASDSCLRSAPVQKFVAEGGDTGISYPERESAYEQAIKLCPGQPSLYYSIVILALQNHDAAGQLRWVKNGLRLWPADSPLLTYEAVALLSGGHPADALPILSRLPVSAENQFYLGMAERALGDHEAAKQALSKAFDLGFPDPYVLYVLMEQDRDLRDKEAGMRDFQKLNERFPDSAWLHVVLGDAYMSRYKDSQAESEYTQALAIDPHMPVVHFQLGRLAFSHENRSVAADEFRKEIDVNPAFGESYLYLGVVLRRDGKIQEALPMLERAVALEPNLPLPYRALAAAQINSNQMQAATATLTEAKKRFPSEPAFAAQLAALLKRMGRPAEAEEESAVAEELSRQGNPPHQAPTSASASNRELSANRSQTATATASAAPAVGPAAKNATSQADGKAVSGPAYAPVFDDLRRCLEREDAACAGAALAAIRDPALLQTTDYLELKAQGLGLEHRQQEALAAIQAAIEGNASEPHYLITQGRLYLSFGRPMDAIASFLRAAKLEPDSPEPLYFIGTTFFLLAQNTHSPDYYRRAVDHFQLALQASPDYPRAEFMLGVIDAVESRLDDARKHLQRAIQLEPSNPYYHLHYGILLKHTADDRGALGEMKTAEEMNPSYALTHFELGTVYEKLGQYAEARTELQAALELNPDLSAPYYHLGAVDARLGLAEQSKVAFAKFNLMKEHGEQPSSDPAASAVSDEDRDR